ncbi:hypothetical protein [Oceanobacillus sp. FSL K6-3682]|uniref:hypothetical protein n=1 Tax=Oceanobacillus sp. FSL K6-3682 TaxID=2921503 RepID=UPI000B2E5EC8
MSNIEDNESIKTLGEAIKGIEDLSKISRFFEADIRDEIETIKKEYETLKNLPDRFNNYFIEYGWIAHEEMKINIMKRAINIFDRDSLEAAERYLTEYYEEVAPQLLERIAYRPLFRDRIHLLKLAMEDYFDGRYHSCVPIFLMQVDGIVNDIKATGLFADNTELDVWDSIAGHSSGLSNLILIIKKNRMKTTNEKIKLPYRNGILHGRDLNYNNKLVAIKSMVLLVYISDWIQSIQSETERKSQYNKEREEIENTTILDIIDRYQEIKERNREMDRLHKKWSPRKNINVEMPLSGTPEHAAIAFFEYISKRNYGSPVQLYPNSILGEVSVNKKAGEFKKEFSKIELLNYVVIWVEDKGSALSEVKIDLSYKLNKFKKQKTIILRLIYEVNGELQNRLVDGGSWKIVNIEGIINLLQ